MLAWWGFQSTHPRGVRPPVLLPSMERPAFQSTHPRGVRRETPRTCSGRPAWFQSTHPRGVRHSLYVRYDQAAGVSIHAPAWGATRSCGRRVTGTSSFNPRTRVGCDLFCVMYMRFVFSFNPRTRVGCDPSPDEVQRYCDVSIHAPAWGATQHRCGRDHADHVSIHAPAWGATRAGDTPRGRGRVSIHAPAWGATVMLMTATPRRRLFQSTHPRGVRRVHMV